MMKKIVTIIACAVALGIALVTVFAHFSQVESPSISDSADKAKTSSKIVIGYSAPGFVGNQHLIMQGLKTRAIKKGWEVLVFNANLNAAKQAEQIEFLIAKGVNAIVAVPIDSEAIASSIKKANVADIPFYTIDRAPTCCNIEMSVLSDNYLAGVQSANAMVELLSKRYGSPKGTVLELQGNLLQNVAQLRGAGFHSVIDKHPDIKVFSYDTKWSAKKHTEYTSFFLLSQKVDGIYMHSDSVGIPNVLSALNELALKHKTGDSRHVFIVGVDGSIVALQGIRDGYVDQASSQPINDFGIIVEWMEKRLNGQEIKEEIVTNTNTLWSPAQVKKADIGWKLLLSTTSVTKHNVDDKRLWANQPQ